MTHHLPLEDDEEPRQQPSSPNSVIDLVVKGSGSGSEENVMKATLYSDSFSSSVSTSFDPRSDIISIIRFFLM
jgi:hypothetical protein